VLDLPVYKLWRQTNVRVTEREDKEKGFLLLNKTRVVAVEQALVYTRVLQIDVEGG
jgi:hypothetical protein